MRGNPSNTERLLGHSWANLIGLLMLIQNVRYIDRYLYRCLAGSRTKKEEHHKFIYLFVISVVYLSANMLS